MSCQPKKLKQSIRYTNDSMLMSFSLFIFDLINLFNSFKEISDNFLHSLNERANEEIFPFWKRDSTKVWNPSSVIPFDLWKI